MAGEDDILERARRVFPGGVNSPIRARVRPRPLVIDRGEGPYLHTVDGRRLVDYVLGYGPLILGHVHPGVAEAILKQVSRGWLHGSLGELEVLLAEKILGHVMPGGMVRFVNSGTEATLTALRLARGVTGRRLIVKFGGSYHGSNDYTLVEEGEGGPRPTSLGVVPECTRFTIVAPFNDVDRARLVFEERGEDIAGVILEPVMANHGLLPAERAFLQELRKLTREHGALLVFDEVVTGFRLALGGAREFYGVEPDIVVLGKVVGGGLPIGAVVAPRDIMEHLAPSGRVFNAGTFNANPLTMAAGLATLEALEQGALEKANRFAEELERGLGGIISERGLEWSVQRLASMLQLYFSPQPPKTPGGGMGAFNEMAYGLLHERMLARGILVPPSQLEVWFTSSAHYDHGNAVLSETLRAFAGALGG